ncbi:hypothetical protein AUR64_15465 [Haloprofundus marisrubri]|uniref:Uncharacterized protein n=1 Tax=Haloprofundus marisrubri TaxID=1514971 RepID=A0A0W1R6Q1_9EURY|nr:hypothetical protein [Haloprofundus marisrubri]KTG09190.1 hypothetical protein AUR64_15465 [Haloprofundus marisrubri]
MTRDIVIQSGVRWTLRLGLLALLSLFVLTRSDVVSESNPTVVAVGAAIMVVLPFVAAAGAYHGGANVRAGGLALIGCGFLVSALGWANLLGYDVALYGGLTCIVVGATAMTIGQAWYESANFRGENAQ